MTLRENEIAARQARITRKRKMSKAEIERRRRKRERRCRKREQREQQVRARLAGRLNDDNAVLTREEWRVLNRLPERSARRILNGPPDKRPVLTQLSDRRDGITVRANREWQNSRVR